ncbi:MAG: phosphoribosyltransferase [Verrucomicrobia bacterium]|nr:phosphoribosyltransferase [Verrucomicrobiota bacterium]
MNPMPPSTTSSVSRPSASPTFKEIVDALAAWSFPPAIDGVVAIATGGIVPGALVAQHLRLDLKTIAISFRNEINEPQFEQPRLVSDVPGLGGWRRVLLVDDVYLSGRSLETARAHLPKSAEILPFVLIGDVDFALFRRPPALRRWPWTAG